MKNPVGERIKSISNIMLVVYSILFIVFGIVLFRNRMVLIGILVIASGIFSAYICYLFTYGYGELIDATLRNEEKLQRLIDAGRIKNDDHTSGPRYGNAPNATPNDIRVTKFKDEPTIVCPNCHKDQPASRKVCSNCGVVLK